MNKQEFIVLKYILLLVVSLYSSIPAWTQTYSSINTAIVLPTKYPSVRYIDLGVGVNLSWGYSFDQQFDVGICIETLRAYTINDNHNLFSFNGYLRYYYLKRNIRPYSGIMVGYNIESYEWWDGLTAFFYGVGLGVKAGSLFRIHHGFYINTEISYSQIHIDRRFDLIGFQIGLHYFFGQND